MLVDEKKLGVFGVDEYFVKRVLLYEEMEENLWSFGAYLKITKIVVAEVRTHPVKKLSLAWKT